ncbi:MAG: hypothetical protein EBR82_29635 [Caulobacteraceae bacterium]|nr:hypothetical protein [Caulobacteraceae bacterium]
MRATLTFQIPDEIQEFNAAMGGEQLADLMRRIQVACQDAIDHPESDDGEIRLAEEILDEISEADIE